MVDAVENGASHDRQIAALVADLRPVERPPPPAAQALAWLGAVAALAAGLAAIGDLDALRGRLAAAPDMWLAAAGSAATAVLAAFAVFLLGRPDRPSAWALLPLPAAALWVGASGAGCLRTWGLPGLEPAGPSDGRDCLLFILGFSVPLSLLLLAMLRRTPPLRPALAAATGGLAAAAAAATLLHFVHPYDASAVDLLAHAVAVAAVVLTNGALARRTVGQAGWLPAAPARDGHA